MILSMSPVLPFLMFALPLVSCGDRCGQRVSLEDNTHVLVIAVVVVVVVVLVVGGGSSCAQIVAVVVERTGYVAAIHAECCWATDNIFAVSSRAWSLGVQSAVLCRGGSAGDTSYRVERGWRWCWRGVLLWVGYAVSLEVISTSSSSRAAAAPSPLLLLRLGHILAAFS